MTSVDAFNGTVFFGTNGIAPGNADWFSLESPVDINLRANTPKPGTMVRFGSGLLGLAGLLRRKTVARPRLSSAKTPPFGAAFLSLYGEDACSKNGR